MAGKQPGSLTDSKSLKIFILSSMIKVDDTKLSQFIASAPAGSVFTNVWLEQQGISSKLAWWYVSVGLLKRVGTKVYKKTEDRVSWIGVVTALQSQMCLPLHVGDITALRILKQPQKGNIREIMLFADLQTRAPS